MAVVKEFTLTTDNTGKITITFKSEVSNAVVNAIEIFAQRSASSAASTGSANNATFNVDNPCTPDDAMQKKGFWDRSTDDMAMADSTFSKDQYPLILKKADQANAILKRSIPDLSGIDVKAHRSIRGSPYVKNGPVQFGVTAGVFNYGCVPMSSYLPDARGKIVLGDETGAWLNVYFNGLGPLAGEDFGGRLANGVHIHRMPKREKDIRGAVLLVPRGLRLVARRAAPASA